MPSLALFVFSWPVLTLLAVAKKLSVSLVRSPEVRLGMGAYRAIAVRPPRTNRLSQNDWSRLFLARDMTSVFLLFLIACQAFQFVCVWFQRQAANVQEAPEEFPMVPRAPVFLLRVSPMRGVFLWERWGMKPPITTIYDDPYVTAFLTVSTIRQCPFTSGEYEQVVIHRRFHSRAWMFHPRY